MCRGGRRAGEGGVVSNPEHFGEKLRRLREEVRVLRRFVNAVLDEWYRFGPGDIDGLWFQDKAEELGVLEAHQVTEACGEECQCSGYGFPVVCYRRGPLVKKGGPPGEGPRRGVSRGQGWREEATDDA